MGGDVEVWEAAAGVERFWSSAGGRMGSHDLHCSHQGANAQGSGLLVELYNFIF